MTKILTSRPPCQSHLMWLLFIFRWACSELKTILPERQDNRVFLLCELFAPASYATSLSYPCDMAHLEVTRISDGATPGRTLTTWYLSEGSPYKTRLPRIKQGYEKGLTSQAIHNIMWYGIVLFPPKKSRTSCPFNVFGGELLLRIRHSIEVHRCLIVIFVSMQIRLSLSL
jgi:hypothetical protein